MIKYILFFAFSLNLHAANVLVMGDSHTAGPFGQELDKNLRAAGHMVGTYGSSSSIPGWFLDGTPSKWGIWSKDVNGHVHEVPFKTSAPTPKFFDLVKQNPEVVIMAFGTNYATKSKKLAIDDMKRFVKVLKDYSLKCYWITPPETRAFRAQKMELFNMIKDTVGDYCVLFESHTVTSYPETGGDGLHYWSGSLRTIANSWAKKAAEKFTSHFP